MNLSHLRKVSEHCSQHVPRRKQTEDKQIGFLHADSVGTRETDAFLQINDAWRVGQ